MCTLVALHRCTPDASLWIAANRDEYLERPADGPALREGRHGSIVAPLDRRAGGTWWGLNAHGVFAAVTNRPTQTPDPTRRSRGQLVLDVLAFRSSADAATALGRLEADAYNPFNLFVADGRDAFAAVYESRPEILEFAPGVHVVGNVDPDARDHPKVRRTLERAEQVASGPVESIAAGLAAICRTHEDDALTSPCVHRGAYGTRSSTLLRLGSDRDLLHHADGPPCTSAYHDFTPLLARLGAPAETCTGELATRKAS